MRILPLVPFYHKIPILRELSFLFLQIYTYKRQKYLIKYVIFQILFFVFNKKSILYLYKLGLMK